jgi:RNA polymerase sigma-70 factor (ECF subfamily)
MADDSSGLGTRASLLLRLRDPKDGEAWQTFVDVYAPLVYGYCRRGLQEADAADVTQEVLTAVARGMPGFTYDPQRGRFRDWLGTLVRRRLGRFLSGRSQAAHGGDDLLAGVAAPEADSDWTAEFHARLLRVALERARPGFEATTWQAFELVWQQNRPAAEVADEIGLPIERVYVAKSRVLKALREVILELAEDLPLPGLGG